MKEFAAKNINTESNEILCARYQAGDRNALELIIRNNEGLVRKYACIYVKLSRGAFDMDDMMDTGYRGLMIAAERYVPSFGTSFSTYAVFWIRHTLRRELRDHGQGIHIPAYIQDAIGRIGRAESRLSGAYTDEGAKVRAIAAMTGLTAAKVAELMEIRRTLMNTTSLDCPIDDSGDAVFGDFLPGTSEASVDETVENRINTELLSKYMGRLSDKERLVIFRRFGFDGGAGATLEEVSRELSLTRERIRQIQEQAIRKLRSYMDVPALLSA